MKRCLFAFLLILLQFGQVVASNVEKRDLLVGAIHDAEQALAIVKSDRLTNYFTVLLQDTVERLEGERLGGDYEAMKKGSIKLQNSDRCILSDDQLVSFNIRCTIIEYIKEKYDRSEVTALLKQNNHKEK